jgi:hypothetical protein
VARPHRHVGGRPRPNIEGHFKLGCRRNPDSAGMTVGKDIPRWARSSIIGTNCIGGCADRVEAILERDGKASAGQSQGARISWRNSAGEKKENQGEPRRGLFRQSFLHSKCSDPAHSYRISRARAGLAL